MKEEKAKEKESVPERDTHKLALGGRVVAVLSIIFLVPFLRRRREQHHERHHRRFAFHGH